MAIYSKLCILCNDEFKTMRISTLFCGKKCANRARALPISIKESLVRRNTQFTMITDRRPAHTVKDEEALLMALAKEEVRKRGIKPPRVNHVVEDNRKFIYPTDPAAGGADGFGLKVNTDLIIEAQHDDDNDNVESDSSAVGNVDSGTNNGSTEDKTNGTGGLASVKRNGLRRLGGR